MVIYGLLVAIAALGIMAATAGFATGFDASVRSIVHSAASAELTEFFAWETWLGSAVVLIPVSAIAAVWMRQAPAGALMFAAFPGAWTLTEMTKAIVHRSRPVAFVGHSPHTWSFPSGHALESAAVYWTIAACFALRGRRFAAGLIATLPIITGLSRVYLGVHYPTDVLAGWAAG